MAETSSNADRFGIAANVARRLCEWADLEGRFSKEREEKFVERDGIEDQILECESDAEKQELKAQYFDVVKAIDEHGRQIKYLNQQINKTLRNASVRSQEVTDPDVLGPLTAPAAEEKKAKDDGQQMLQAASLPPSDASDLDGLLEIDEADSARLSEYLGVGPDSGAPSWIDARWDEAPFRKKHKIDATIGEKWFATFDQIGAAAIAANLTTPSRLLDEISLSILVGAGWRKDAVDFDVARVLVQEAARQQLLEPTGRFREFLAAFVKVGKIDELRAISPLAAALAERDRDICGAGDGTAGAPDGPEGGSSGRSKKREAAATGRKKGAGRKAGRGWGASA